jgi:hypothetical protein
MFYKSECCLLTKKSVFKSQKVKYLRFVINSDQIEKDSDKMITI